MIYDKDELRKAILNLSSMNNNTRYKVEGYKSLMSLV